MKLLDIMYMEYNFKAPDDDMFSLWRSVFALVHVDGNFSQDEKIYIKEIVNTFSFTFMQKRTINKDLKKKIDVVELFDEIEDVELRRQFFIISRTIVWCDGFLHELEMRAMNRIVKNLGKEAELFHHELRWIDRKPSVEVGETHDTPEEDLMGIVIEQMSALYKERII